MEPFLFHMQQEVGILSGRGISAILDESADGFVKGDTTCCVLLQRRPTAKRIYASVLCSRMNIDGHKKVGMYFPSSEMQESLMVTAYKEAAIDPLKLTYIEGHFTGTKVDKLCPGLRYFK
jgi:acyl transferase domain-containing protein